MDQRSVLKESLGSFLRNLWDLMIINWLWLLCSLPVITLGPATCGLYRVTLKLARKEAVYPVKDFFRGFRDSLKQGTVLGLLAVGMAAVAAVDAFFAIGQTGMLRSVYLTVAIVVASVLLTVTAYGFALQAMFRNSVKGILLNAAKLAVIAPGKTVLMWIILLAPAALALLLPPIALQMLGFLYVILGFSGPVYACSHILRDLFDKVANAAVQ